MQSLMSPQLVSYTVQLLNTSVAAAITRVEWGTLGDVGGSGTDWFRYIHLRTSPHHLRRRTGSPGSPDLLGMLHHV